MRWTLALLALALPGRQESADKAPGFPTEVFKTFLPSHADRKPGEAWSLGLAGTTVGVLIWPRQMTAGPYRDGLDHSGIRDGCYFSIEGKPLLPAEFEVTEKEEERVGIRHVRYDSENRIIRVASGPEKLRTYPRLSRGPGVYERLKAKGDLSGPISLVEVEVNDGLGSPKEAPSFVVTRVKTIEGAPGFALKALDALKESKRLHDEALPSRRDEIEALVAPLRKDLTARFEKMQKEARGRHVGGSGGEHFPWMLTGDRSTEATYYYATWLAERELLQVNWFTRYIEGDTATGEWHDGHSEVPPRRMEWGVAFGVEVGNSYSFDKTGKLVEQRAVGPKAFQKVQPIH